MKRIAKGYWVWGQFDEKSANKLEEIKQRANRALKGPCFDIHLTISGPLFNLESKTKNYFNNLGKSVNGFKLEARAYEFKDDYFQAFFIAINKSEDLLELKKTIDAKLNLKETKYFPHISLFYGRQESLVKKQLARSLPEIPREIYLEKLSLVKVDENIQSWKIIQSVELNNPSLINEPIY